MTRRFLRIQLAFDNDLSGDTSMIGAGNPQCIFTQHASVPYQPVHDGLIECMTHVQGAGYVWRGQLDAEILSAFFKRGDGDTSALPFRTPKGLYGGRFVGFGKFGRKGICRQRACR